MITSIKNITLLLPLYQSLFQQGGGKDIAVDPVSIMFVSFHGYYHGLSFNHLIMVQSLRKVLKWNQSITITLYTMLNACSKVVVCLYIIEVVCALQLL